MTGKYLPIVVIDGSYRYLKGLLTLEKIYLPVLVRGSMDEPDTPEEDKFDLQKHVFDNRSVISQV